MEKRRRNMIWNREQYIAHCNFEFTGREFFCELFGPLHTLEAEWRRQGATEKEIAMTAFDWDYVMRTGLSGSIGAITGKSTVILEDTPEYTISIDRMGRKQKLIKKSATIPLPMEYPVKCMDDWLKVKHWYEFSENRINVEKLKHQKELHDKGYLTLISIPGGFDEPRQLMGEEDLCIAYYDDPELIEDMMTTFTDTALKVLERVGEIVPIDNLCVHEDMAGKSGPLIGPNLISEFIAPYYQKVWDCARSYGAKIFSQDSDGNMNPIIDAFLDCGVNCFFPLEPAAGMDIVEIRKKYGNVFILPQCAAAGDLAPRQLHYKKAKSRRYLLKYGDVPEKIQNRDRYLDRFEIAERVGIAFDEVYAWARKEILYSAPLSHRVLQLSLPRRPIDRATYEEAKEGFATAMKQPFVSDKTPEENFMENYKLGKNLSKQGTPRNAGDGVVTYSEPSIAGVTQYWIIFAS